MKAAIYEGFGFAHSFREIQIGRTLKDSLPDIDFDSCAVVVNAKKADGNYCPKAEDGIIIRVLPKGSVVTVISVISLALTVVAGVVAGVVAYKQNQELERQKEELER